MTHNQRTSDSTRSAILSYVRQSELRGAHNFAETAQPIVTLDLATTPTPWSQDPSSFDRAANNQPHNLQDRDGQIARAPLPDRQAVTIDLARPPATRSPLIGPDTVAETDFLFKSRLSEADPPFHPPASWQKPVDTEQNDGFLGLIRSWNWSERSTAAFLGFAAGILIVVPVVLFLSVTSDQRPIPAPTAAAEKVIAQPDLAPVAFANASVSAGTWFDTKAAKPAGMQHKSTEAIAVVSQAHRAITEGRINHARTMLRAAASPDMPRLWFILAETYDPLVSGRAPHRAPSSHELEAADTNFARFYYQQALAHGISEARSRLDGLTKQ